MSLNKKSIINLVCAAEEAVYDFDVFGELWQSDSRGNYSSKTALGKLRKAVTVLRKQLDENV